MILHPEILQKQKLSVLLFRRQRESMNLIVVIMIILILKLSSQHYNKEQVIRAT